jgi:beta-lactamase regulating signal transducer with metallopeptidase domain
MMLLAEAALRSSLLIAAVWSIFRLFRLRNPHTRMAVWTGVLLISLVMPLLMRWVPAEPLPMPTGFHYVWSIAPAMANPPTHKEVPASFPLASLLLAAYLTAALILAARMGTGLVQSLRLKRRASRVLAPWTEGRDIRLSADLAMPAAVGRTILLPLDFLSWDPGRRQAVMAHETSHVERGDFYLLLLSALHRAIFWFNPLSWWLDKLLTDLAEVRSDMAALAVTGDRLSYAQILLDLAGRTRSAPPVPAMAAHATVRQRIERILSENTLPARLTPGKLALIATGIIPAALAAAGATPAFRDAVAGYYALPNAPDLPLKVWREGRHLFAGRIGEAGGEIAPEKARFLRDDDGRATVLVLHQDGRDYPAYRLDEAAVQALEKQVARRIADNRPQAGAEAALRRHIDQVQRGAIDDDSLGKGMGEAIRGLLPQIQPDMAALGPIAEVKFQGVGPDGMDVYIVTHAHGTRRWQIRLSQDGRIESLWFSPL